jgi:vitamin B12 transporter
MVLRLVCFCMALCCSTLLLAQPDTIMLAPVAVYGVRIVPYATGSKVSTVNLENSAQTLADKLSAEAALYFKNYGNQQLSTISFRGTTASQTAVLWNGINVNSPTLGLTDFSLVPVFLVDEMMIHYGASGALTGNDAIGGSVALKSSAPVFEKRILATGYVSAGSFGRRAEGIKLALSNSRWHSATRLYVSKVDNDFPYTSPAVGFKRVQENAAVENKGLSQQLAFKINSTQQLTADGLYVHNHRHNQPAVTNFGANETTEDKQLRLALRYDNVSPVGVLRATVAHVRDVQIYTDDESSTVRTAQWMALVNIDKQINHRTSIRWGGSASRFEANGENYPRQLRDNRFDVFASVRYQLLQNWVMSTNLRQTVYNNQYVPFTPSMGTEVKVLERQVHAISLRAQAGRAFRIPTLNDRYWQPGGNPALKAEAARQLEAAVNWRMTKNNFQLEADVTGYQTKANEMIVWQASAGIWRPENLQRVKIRGAEATFTSTAVVGNFKTRLTAAYSFTKSTNKKSALAEHVNKQLPYVPLHAGRVVAAMQRWNWRAELSNNITSARFVSLDNVDKLTPFALADFALGKSIRLQSVSLLGTVQVNNLLNVYYEMLNNHAMPGRNYALSISLTFNNKPK